MQVVILCFVGFVFLVCLFVAEQVARVRDWWRKRQSTITMFVAQALREKPGEWHNKLVVLLKVRILAQETGERLPFLSVSEIELALRSLVARNLAKEVLNTHSSPEGTETTVLYCAPVLPVRS